MPSFRATTLNTPQYSHYLKANGSKLGVSRGFSYCSSGIAQLVLWLRLGGPGFESRQAHECCCSPVGPNQLWGTLRILFSGYRALFLRGEIWPNREDDHSPVRVLNAEVKTNGAINSGPVPLLSPPYTVMLHTGTVFFFTFVTCILILSKFYLFTNWCTSELS